MKTVYRVNVEEGGILLKEKLFFKYDDAKKFMDSEVERYNKKYPYNEDDDEFLEYYLTRKNVFLRIDDATPQGCIVWQVYINEATIY